MLDPLTRQARFSNWEHAKVEYDTFVQWLYAPAKPARLRPSLHTALPCCRVQDSRLSELVLSRTSPPSHIRIFSSVLVGISRYT